MFWQRRQTQFLKEFGAHIELYQIVHVLSYLPLSQTIGAWEENRDRAPIEVPIVLLEVEMPKSFKRYRWQRPGMLEAVERAETDEEWQLIFNRIERDLRRELDKKIIEWTI
jgi:hypothetical protein